jgi:cell wall assembly regulator SMI1
VATPIEIAQVLKHWRGAGVSLNGGASAEQIAEVEKECGLQMPEALSALYQLVNGMPEGRTDPQLFWLWPIEKIASESKAWNVPSEASILLFGDFLIASHAYGVRCRGSDIGSVHLFDGNRFERVADSLSAFFAALVKDPNRIRLLRSDAV